MKKQYLTEFLLSQDSKLIRRGKINLIDADTGCGKTTFIFGDDGLIKNTTKYSDARYNLSINMNRVLYVCDTQTLKDEVINDNLNKVDIFKVKANKSYEDSKFNIDRLLKADNKIKICTYALLGRLMNSEYHRRKIYESFDLVIFDEVHKLIEYSNKYDTELMPIYRNVINELKAISNNTLLVCLSATPWLFEKQIESMDSETKAKLNYVLTSEAKECLNTYATNNEIRVNNILNIVKELCISSDEYLPNVKEKKILIFTKRISRQKEIKEMLCEAGYNAEYLCSQSKLETTEQKQLRKYILQNKEYPDELDVLIINEAYDTGWNLKRDNVQLIIVDISNITTIKQVRGRVRADVELLIRTDSKLKEVNDKTIEFKLPVEYLREKLTKDMKDYLVKKYATVKCDGKCNWKTFKYDLENNGYIVKSTRTGSFIYSKNDESVKDDKATTESKTNSLESKHNEISTYIESILGKKLYSAEDKKELIEVMNIRSNGKLLKSYTSLNNALEDMNLPYTILNKKSDNKRYWVIDRK